MDELQYKLCKIDLFESGLDEKKIVSELTRADNAVARMCDSSRKMYNSVPSNREQVMEMLVWTLLHTFMDGNNLAGEPRKVYGGFVRDHLLGGHVPNDIDIELYIDEAMATLHDKQNWIYDLQMQLKKDWPNAYGKILKNNTGGGLFTLKQNYSTSSYILANFHTITNSLYESETPSDGLDQLAVDGQPRNVVGVKHPGITCSVDNIAINKHGLILKRPLSGDESPFPGIGLSISHCIRRCFVFYLELNGPRPEFPVKRNKPPLYWERVQRLESRGFVMLNDPMIAHKYPLYYNLSKYDVEPNKEQRLGYYIYNPIARLSASEEEGSKIDALVLEFQLNVKISTKVSDIISLEYINNEKEKQKKSLSVSTTYKSPLSKKEPEDDYNRRRDAANKEAKIKQWDIGRKIKKLKKFGGGRYGMIGGLRFGLDSSEEVSVDYGEHYETDYEELLYKRDYLTTWMWDDEYILSRQHLNNERQFRISSNFRETQQRFEHDKFLRNNDALQEHIYILAKKLMGFKFLESFLGDFNLLAKKFLESPMDFELFKTFSEVEIPPMPVIMTNQGYITEPPIEQLRNMHNIELSNISNFYIEKVGVGRIEWEGEPNNPIDLKSVNLDDFEIIKTKKASQFDIYDKYTKPPIGKKLNRRARLIMYDVIMSDESIDKLRIKLTKDKAFKPKSFVFDRDKRVLSFELTHLTDEGVVLHTPAQQVAGPPPPPPPPQQVAVPPPPQQVAGPPKKQTQTDLTNTDNVDSLNPQTNIPEPQAGWGDAFWRLLGMRGGGNNNINQNVKEQKWGNFYNAARTLDNLPLLSIGGSKGYLKNILFKKISKYKKNKTKRRIKNVNNKSKKLSYK
jgi:hypothetical protein